MLNVRNVANLQYSGSMAVSEDQATVRQYVEDFGATLAGLGLPPAYGRLMAWLLVCQPASQSVTEMAEATGMSKGSVSTSIRLIESAGLARRVARPGRRGTFYEMPPEALMSVTEDSARYRRFREVLERGIDLLGGRDDPRTERLRVTRDFYAFVEKELGQLVERFRADQKSGPKKEGRKDG